MNYPLTVALLVAGCWSATFSQAQAQAQVEKEKRASATVLRDNLELHWSDDGQWMKRTRPAPILSMLSGCRAH